MQGNKGKIIKQTVVWPCSEIIKARLLSYGTNSANRQKYPNNKLDLIIRDNKQCQ
jgi:hypothetical protein